VQGDARFLPFSHDQFDLVINADLIEHTHDQDKALIFAEMFRVIRPGARGLVYSPNVNRVRWELRGEKIKKLLGIRRAPVPDWRSFVDPDHFGMISSKQAEWLLRQAGFITRTRFYEFHVPLLSKLPGFNRFARHWLSNQFANRYLIAVEKPKLAMPAIDAQASGHTEVRIAL
jgi:ubiquinone/menaquinone biosynthesis C-methylase UbiE